MSHHDQLVSEIEKELKQKGIKLNANIELEQDFSKLMNEINIEGLGLSEKFKEELEKIFAVFQITLANEKIFNKLYRDLKKENLDTYNKLQKITEQQKENQRDIDILTQKLYNAQNEKQSIERQKELSSKNEFLYNDKLKDDMSAEDSNVEKLEKEKEFLRNKIENLTKNLTKVEEEKKDFYEKMSVFKKKNEEMKAELGNLNDSLDKLKNKYESKKNEYDTSESNLSMLREQLKK